MSTCVICDHPKIQDINAALLSGRHFAVVTRQFRLEKEAMAVHATALHFRPRGLTAQDQSESASRQVSDVFMSRETSQEKAPEDAERRGGVLIQVRAQRMVTENPLSQFKQAWQLAKDDARMQAQMIQWLNEQLRSDDMGLP